MEGERGKVQSRLEKQDEAMIKDNGLRKDANSPKKMTERCLDSEGK